MKKINLGITGCMGRMGQELIKSALKDKSIKLVSLTENFSINRKIGGVKPVLNSERAFSTILSLPSSVYLDDEQTEYIIKTLNNYN